MKRLCLWALLWAPACAFDHVVADLVPGGADVGAGQDAAPRPDLGPSTCPFVQAANAPQVCTCGALSASAPVHVMGDVGVGEDLDFNDAFRANRLTVVDQVRGGAGGAFLTQLQVGSSWASGGPLEVSGDAEVGGRIQAGTLVVGGTLTQPDGAAREVASATLGAERRAPVGAPAAPCPCDAFTLPTRLRGASVPAAAEALPGALDLSCEVRAFRAANPAPLSVTLRARAVLVVEGRFAGELDLSGPAGAELDLVVLGDVDLSAWRVSPGVTLRLFSTSAGSLRIPAGWSGFRVEAPDAEWVAPNGASGSGSILVRRAAVAGPLTLSP